MNALGSIFAGFPDVGSLFGPGVSINSGNNISIQTGPNNVNPGQWSSVSNNGSQNTNNVSTCRINGRCCVQTDDAPPTCTP